MVDRARRVCAVFPLLPDPTDFLRRVGERFPGAEIGLFTANPEAAHRARQAGVRDVFFRPLNQVAWRVPAEVRSDDFDVVALHVQSDHFADYAYFVLQAMTWRGVERVVEVDGHWRDLAALRGRFVREFALPTISRVGAAVLLNAAYAIGVLPAWLIGRLRGNRRETDVGVSLRRLGSPLAWLTVSPGHLAGSLCALACVLRDLARDSAPATPRRRALLIRLDHIGDLVLNTALLDTLKNAAEPWEVTVVVGPWAAAVAEGDERIDRLVIYPSADPAVCRRKHPAEAARERRRVRQWLAAQQFELVLDPIACADSTTLAYLPQAHRRVVMHLNRWWAHGAATVLPLDAAGPEPARLRRLLAAGGVEASPERPRVVVSETVAASAARLREQHGLGDGKYLLIHPGASWAGKLWPAGRFAEIALRARNQWGWRPLAVFGAGEDESRERFTDLLRGVDGVTLIGLPLPTVFALIAEAGAFVGNDSGLMHAAAALHVPTVGVFGPSDRERWTPHGDHVRSVGLDLGCAPCSMSYCTDPRCLLELSVEPVWEALRAVMAAD